MKKFTFSGHESFHCRHFWLKKGYDFVKTQNKFSEPDAVVELGVGKNMVYAIRYWMRAFGLLDEMDELTNFADFLFGDNGKDPYLENIGTLWLLHWDRENLGCKIDGYQSSELFPYLKRYC